MPHREVEQLAAQVVGAYEGGAPAPHRAERGLVGGQRVDEVELVGVRVLMDHRDRELVAVELVEGGAGRASWCAPRHALGRRIDRGPDDQVGVEGACQGLSGFQQERQLAHLALLLQRKPRARQAGGGEVAERGHHHGDHGLHGAHAHGDAAHLAGGGDGHDRQGRQKDRRPAGEEPGAGRRQEPGDAERHVEARLHPDRDRRQDRRREADQEDQLAL